MMGYKSNKRQVIQRMRKANENMLDAVGRAGKSIVRANTAVDTGALRDSIEYIPEENTVHIGSTLIEEDYPIFIEKGSSRMPAQPYIGTLLNNTSQLKSVAERNYKL